MLTACPVPFQFCQARQKAALLELLHELYNFLAIQAGECIARGLRFEGCGLLPLAARRGLAGRWPRCSVVMSQRTYSETKSCLPRFSTQTHLF